MKPILSDIPIIAVSGTCGKTTTKEMIASVLQSRLNTFKSPKNKNFFTATMRHVKNINSNHEAVVLELHMARIGDGKQQCSIIRPDIGVITCVGLAHLQANNTIHEVAKAKSELIHYMNPSGVLLINNDDEESKLLQTEEFKGRIIRVGMNEESDIYAFNINWLTNGMCFSVKLNNKTERFIIPLFGYHNVINSLYAIAIGNLLGLKPSEIKAGLENMEIISGRLNIVNFKRGITIIDDSYNANPKSMKAAINVLNELGKSRKKVAVLGDMAELGNHTVAGHEEVGKYLAILGIDCLVTYGEKAKNIIGGLPLDRQNPTSVYHYDNQDELFSKFKNIISDNTIVLFKGSRVMRMDRLARYFCIHYGNYSMEKLLQDYEVAVLEGNWNEAILLIHNAISHYNEPPLSLFIKLAMLYVEDNEVEKAFKILEEGETNFNKEELSIVKDFKTILEREKARKEKLAENRVKLKEAKRKLAENRVKLNETKAQLKMVRNKYKALKGSKLWRYTSPIRKVSKLVKRLLNS